MTLLDAKQYDPEVDRRRHIWIAGIVMAAVLMAWLAYHFRDYPERHLTEEFFATLQQGNYETAYGLWYHDPNWKQHPDKYKTYSYGDFYRDWGPGGEWGQVKNYEVDCSVAPGGNGVIVQVTINHRLQHAYLWIDKGDKTLSFSPNDIDCGNWWGWVAE
jgi:hypothetical protein